MEKKLSSKTVYSGKVITVTEDIVSLENGAQAIRECVHHHGAVAIVAIHEEKMVLVKQYRYVIGEYTLEIPAGKVDKGEEPIAAAFRELAEETPFTASSLELMQEVVGAIGFCDERVRIYHANGLMENSALSLDEDEFLSVVYLTKDEVKEKLRTGQIVDGKTIIAMMSWLLGDIN